MKEIEVIEKLRACHKHPQRKTPLIWTFAFPGAEYWCPYCGYHSGMFGAGEWIPSTLELEGIAMGDEAAARPYLAAYSFLSCSEMLYNRQWIFPDQLPQQEKEKYIAIIAAWEYPILKEHNG